MKKILLISLNRHHVPYPVYPIGVGYLRGYLERHLEGFGVEVIDCNLCDDGELEARIAAIDPAYIGLSLRNVDGANSLDMSNFIGDYDTIIRKIRSACAVPVIVGGAGFSVFPRAIFDRLKPDYGITGEGEESFRQLIMALETGSTSEIEGVVRYDGEKFVENCHRKYISSFDLALEPPLVDYYWRKSGMLNIQTKRGCPYNCIYCSYPLIDGRAVRTIDAGQIVDNLKKFNAESGVDYVFFTDSVFNIANGYNVELAEKIIRSGLKIRWGAYFSPSNLTDETMAIFRASGLTHIEFGTESFCNQQLINYGKNFDFGSVLESSELCLKHNVYYAHFLILGGYGETEESLRETFENSQKIRHSVFFPYFGMRIYPRTRLQEIAVREVRIAADDPLLEPAYYLADGFDTERVKQLARETGKAWIFPDDPQNGAMDVLREKRNKKGLLWEYLRRP